MAVPMQLAETVASLWPVLQELALCGNPACRSDLQVPEELASCSGGAAGGVVFWASLLAGPGHEHVVGPFLPPSATGTTCLFCLKLGN